jgi:hypothetical protein
MTMPLSFVPLSVVTAFAKCSFCHRTNFAVINKLEHPVYRLGVSLASESRRTRTSRTTRRPWRGHAPKPLGRAGPPSRMRATAADTRSGRAAAAGHRASDAVSASAPVDLRVNCGQTGWLLAAEGVLADPTASFPPVWPLRDRHESRPSVTVQVPSPMITVPSHHGPRPFKHGH